MRVNGEVFFLINGWMNYLSLFLAAHLGRVRLKRAALASALGAAYALAAWSGASCWRSVPALALIALGMAGIAFGRCALRLWPLVMTSGWLLSGLCDFLWKRGLPAGAVTLLCGAAVLALIRLLNGRYAPADGKCTVEIRYGGAAVRLPALRDSGNLLRDGVTGLPVIVAPWKKLRPILPPALRPDRPDSLQPGFRLMGVRTTVGERMLMCFHPEETAILCRRKRRTADAVIVLSDADLSRALVPDRFFVQEADHALF